MLIAGLLLSLLCLNSKDMSKINNPAEIWKAIPEYEGYYEVSSFGQIKTLARTITQAYGCKRFIPEKIVTLKNQGNYAIVLLSKNGFRKQFYVHRLVAEAFCEKSDGNIIVNHIDGNKRNNNCLNLEWVTYRQNLLHAYETGLMRKGEWHKYSKPVIKLTMQGEYICEYVNSQVAASVVNGDSANIRRVCIGTYGYAYGHKWKYKNPEDVGKVFQERYKK